MHRDPRGALTSLRCATGLPASNHRLGIGAGTLRILLAVPLALATAAPAIAHGISAADRQAMLEGGHLQYLWLGASHMLTGYDHLLFIFGVIFFLTGAREVIRYVTAFTLGHSVTLIFATLLGISANYYLVDAVIALSVCYKGFDNLDGFRRHLAWEPPNLLSVIFAFGLIHGFGLSTRLQQLPLGDDTTGLVLRILSFNVGVELGQVAALLGMVVILAGWRGRPTFRRFSSVANGGLVAAGILLFLLQLHGYTHLLGTEEFPLNKDAHYHHHEQLDVKKARQKISGNLLGEE